MKHNTQKLWSVLLTLTLLLSLVPAARAADGYQLWIGGVRVTDANANDVFGDGTVRFTPASGQEPGVLELNGCRYSGKGYMVDVTDSEGKHYSTSAALYYESKLPLEIRLTGENSLEQVNGEAVAQAVGMYLRNGTENVLTITGTDDKASLTVSCGSADTVASAIASNGALTIENLRVSAVNRESDSYGYGVYSNLDLTIRGCELNAGGGESARNSFGLYTMNGDIIICGDSKVEAVSEAGEYSTAIYADAGSVRISDSKVTARGGKAARSGYGISATRGDVVVRDSEVTAESGETGEHSDGINAGGNVLFDGSRVNAVGARGHFSFGVMCFEGTVRIDGGEVHAGSDFGVEQSGGICSNDVFIDGGSVVEATGGDTESEQGASLGVTAFCGNITIDGDSTVVAASGKAAESYAINAYDWEEQNNECGVNILSGTVSAIGGAVEPSYGIYANFVSIGKNAVAVTAVGETLAIFGTVKNAVDGKGWTARSGAGEGSDIPANEEGAELPDHKKVSFESVPDVLDAFRDVNKKSWYAPSVRYVVENGIMSGMGDGTFAPNGTTTRAQLATLLWNLEDRPGVGFALSFSDVTDNRWFADPVRWATAQGLMSGYGDGKFGPNDPLTREQLVTIFYRYAEMKGRDVSVGEDTNILSYTDAFSVSEWAIPAMQWAVGSGLVSGKTPGMLKPADTATRAEIATIVMRFCESAAQQ